MKNPLKNYLSTGNYTYEYKSTNSRSVKKKLLIVLSFIFILAITPSLIYTRINLSLSKTNDVSLAANSQEIAQENTPNQEVYKVIIKEANQDINPESTQIKVINNDSYWKISVRACKTGKYYLSIRDQNNAKPLYEGESIKATCNF